MSSRESKGWKIGRWIAIAAGGVLVTLTIIAGVGSRTSTLRRLVIETLGERLDSEVQLEAFSVDFFPTVDVHGEGLVVKLRGHDDQPPLLKIKSFEITGGIFGLLSRPRRFSAITLEGLEITIPPGGTDFRDALWTCRESRGRGPAVVLTDPHRSAGDGRRGAAPDPQAGRQAAPRIPDSPADDERGRRVSAHAVRGAVDQPAAARPHHHDGTVRAVGPRRAGRDARSRESTSSTTPTSPRSRESAAS